MRTSDGVTLHAAVDRRSHGLSEAPAFGHRMSRHGKDLRDALDQLDLGEVVHVGQSMGRRDLGLRGPLRHRGRAGVVTVDQTPRMTNTEDRPYGLHGPTDENSGTFFARVIPDTGRGFTRAQATPALVRLIEKAGPAAAPSLPPVTEALLFPGEL
ncbi:hypothetical protein [Pseudonocardia xishanensis]|uniref:Uncharacterized protein n=1 Tax=Pseudonocardia xishanensis TaxID=630995 RepID=A0ABP8RSB3_9PSEU